jgi:putative spermidine/putrescine transport system permease protein
MTVAAPPEARSPRPVPRLALRHRLAEHGVDRVLLLLAPGAAFLVLVFLYPFINGLVASFQVTTTGYSQAAIDFPHSPFANYLEFFTVPYNRNSIFTTLGLAIPVALFNVGLSVPIAYRMRGRIRFKRTITTLLVVPFTFGAVLIAAGMLDYFDPTKGWFNRILIGLHIVGQPIQLIHNYWAVAISLIISGYPFAFLLILSYVSGIDPGLERAAATMGARPWQRFRHITLPLLAPGLAITFCLSFVFAFTVFPSAVLVGDPTGSTRVLSIVIANAQSNFDLNMANAAGMVMATIEMLVIGGVLLLRSGLYRGATTGGKG